MCFQEAVNVLPRSYTTEAILLFLLIVRELHAVSMRISMQRSPTSSGQYNKLLTSLTSSYRNSWWKTFLTLNLCNKYFVVQFSIRKPDIHQCLWFKYDFCIKISEILHFDKNFFLSVMPQRNLALSLNTFLYLWISYVMIYKCNDCGNIATWVHSIFIDEVLIPSFAILGEWKYNHHSDLGGIRTRGLWMTSLTL